MTQISATNAPSALQASLKAANARAADGDYKTAGLGHTVKDSDGDYKATPATGAGAAARTASTTLAAVMSLGRTG